MPEAKMGNSENYLKGQKGEDIAKHYFRSAGFEIIAQNYRYQRAEIDLILRKDALLVFVEVKYHQNMGYGFPEESISLAQEERILSAAEEFLLNMEWQGELRFDILAINSQDPADVLHIEDVFF